MNIVVLQDYLRSGGTERQSLLLTQAYAAAGHRTTLLTFRPDGALALGIGVVGYHYLGELEWLDALLNASMILGGMGPVDPLHKPGAKLFASGYASFSGLAFIGVASLLVAPFAHRLLHRFHLDER